MIPMEELEDERGRFGVSLGGEWEGKRDKAGQRGRLRGWRG